MTIRMATFTLAGHTYGIDVDNVQEVLRSQSRTRVPLAPAAVAGLVNLRGQVLTAIDLREQLQLPPRTDGEEPMVVVIRVAGEPISLLVDSIGDVVDVDPSLFEPPPDTLGEGSRELVLGAYKLPGRLLLALDPERAVAV
ncbi:MAG TPA: chemotaxis protein CheW [Actinomycetales bacterium]|jgi:purine-binding chemotaxis protein CheW